MIATIDVADPPDAWRDLGFAVDRSCSQVGSVVMQLGVPGRGVTGWSLDSVAAEGEADSLDGLPTRAGSVAGTSPPQHPNGVLSIDHVVILTPDLQRTINTFELAGMPCRRLRPTGRGNSQAFFRLGEVILEVVGPDVAKDDGPSRFFGLALTVADLDATAAYLGDRLHAAKEAVQPGRRIATLDKAAGSSVAIAFMSPEPPR